MAFAKMGNAQDVEFDSIIVSEIFKEKVEIFEVDRFNMVYVVNPRQDLIKFGTEGEELFRYSNYNNGPISKIDISNPMQILVYYSDFLLVKMLDRTLSEIGSLSLQNQDIYNSVSLCRSNNNGLWIFDPLSQILQRVDQLGESPSVSQNLAMRFNKSFFPTQIIEYQNRLLMLVPEDGVLVFDIFGQYLETLNFETSVSVCPYGEKIFSLKDGHLISLDLETGTKTSLKVLNSDSSINTIKFSGSYFYYLDHTILKRIELIR